MWLLIIMLIFVYVCPRLFYFMHILSLINLMLIYMGEENVLFLFRKTNSRNMRDSVQGIEL